MRGEIEWIELQRLAQEGDDPPVLAGLRELRRSVAQRGERAGSIGLLHADLREPAIAARSVRELRAQVAELLFGLAQTAGLQLAQARGERDLVVEVLDRWHPD